MVKMVEYGIVREENDMLVVVESVEVEEGADVMLTFEADADAKVEDGAWWL